MEAAEHIYNIFSSGLIL